VVYGWLYSAASFLHMLVRVADIQLASGHDSTTAAAMPLTNAQLSQVSSSATVQSAPVWQLTNGLYALFDQQVGKGAETVSQAKFATWRYHPSAVVELLLQ
jgi:hypothetical protein